MDQQKSNSSVYLATVCLQHFKVQVIVCSVTDYVSEIAAVIRSLKLKLIQVLQNVKKA